MGDYYVHFSLPLHCTICIIIFRLRLMIDQLDAIWKKSIASNCYLYINKAVEKLDETIKIVGHQIAGILMTCD